MKQATKSEGVQTQFRERGGARSLTWIYVLDTLDQAKNTACAAMWLC